MRTLPYLATVTLATFATLAAACSATTLTNAPAPSEPCNLASAPPRVQLFGGIKRPGGLAYEPGLTVFGAIARAGGLEPSAVAHQVRIVRCGHSLGPFAIPAAAGAQTDLPLERGDVLDIPVELF
jgi:protein involved in polysaccharide export with SLBB domain